ncbi:Bifunctional transcriptional activator/DNA repair enzyme AdaA [Planctomycetes bacterium Pan216]|uniref:Bifunctional transcriptional activator/DNA repair enzyme AdaA n=1 Tax=Kolteria novifilia TaxID=2527975 RepID=A0A518BAY0_9BACT|nr:Bifunctional transcriptional activator/DNA repair enzyme AdaA [Planctomycetes bacterium Pan216]
MRATIEKVEPPESSSFRLRERRESAFAFYWHFHPEFELTYIDRSRGRRFVGDSIEDYADADLVLLGPNLPHAWCSDGSRGQTAEHVARFVQFDRAFLGEDFFERPELAACRRLLERSARGLCFQGPLRQRIGKRLAAMEKLGPLPRITALLEILDELAHVCRIRELSSPGFQPRLDQRSQRRIDAVCRWINDRFREPLTQTEAARRCHLSPAGFSRFFKRATGKTFVGYVNDLRVGWACRELVESDNAITRVAFAAGFANMANFHRRFQERVGKSPREFRKEHQRGPSGVV